MNADYGKIVGVSDWRNNPRLVKARESVMLDATRNGRTMAEKEETCPVHGCKTVNVVMLGLWPCPKCCRVYFNKPLKSAVKVRLPYKDEEPPIIEANELDAYLPPQPPF